jgi:prepilin-type N-terminal cleavage/methylation domain-containing protein
MLLPNRNSCLAVQNTNSNGTKILICSAYKGSRYYWRMDHRNKQISATLVGRNARAAAGFSLIEITIVLIIIGVLFAVILPPLAARVAASRLEATRVKEDQIKSALIAFVSRNNRLPCPAIETLPPTDANYGREAATPGTCTGTTVLTTGAVRGVVPWLALGLNDDIALDGYFQRYTYVVTTSQTNLNANTVSGMTGNIAMHSASPVAVANQTNVNNLAVIVLISHGTNTAGAFTQSGTRISLPTGADELENTDAGNVAYIKKDLSENAANPFDDIVMAITPTEILNGLEKSGVKTAQGAINEKFDGIKNAVLSFVVADVLDPDGAGARARSHRLPAADNNGDGVSDATVQNGTVPFSTIGLTQVRVVDPWGNAIRYAVGTAALFGNTAAASTVGIYSATPIGDGFVLRSAGPDGTLNNADDVTFAMSVAEIRGLLITNNQLTD